MDSLLSCSYAETFSLNASCDFVKFDDGTNVLLNVDSTEDLVERNRDSARVHTHVISDYKWPIDGECRGRSLAVYKSIVAYKVSSEATGEAVRILERNISVRHLVKSFQYPIADIVWASHAPLLAVLDIKANVFVYSVDELQFLVSKYANIIRSDDVVPVGVTPRVTWCPYMSGSNSHKEMVHMIGVYFGSTVELVNLTALEPKPNDEVHSIEEIADMPKVMIKLPAEQIPNAEVVCISPDATAVGVALKDGSVSFFIIDDEYRVRFAHRWYPDPPWRIQNLLFLNKADEYSQRSSDGFWKFAITSTDRGQRIQLHAMDQWQRIARIHFESKDDNLTRLAMTVDPVGRMLFLSDYDAANVFCIGIGYKANRPFFTSCTLITFCRPLVSVSPVSLVVSSEQNFVAFDEEDEVSKASLIATLAALNQRSLVYLEVDLDLCPEIVTVDSYGAMLNNKTTNEMNSAIETKVRRDNDESEIRQDCIAEMFTQGLGCLSDKLESQAEKIENLRVEMHEQLIDVTRQIREEFASREQCLLGKIEDHMMQTHQSIVNGDALLKNMVENLVHNIKVKEVDIAMEYRDLSRETLNELIRVNVIPSVERTCRSLFKDLNECFKKGLSEFMTELASIRSEIILAKDFECDNHESKFDKQRIVQLICAGGIVAAFEKALEHKNMASLLFICSRVDWEGVNSNKFEHLPPLIILGLLHVLSENLSNDDESDQKLRYIENGLLNLKPDQVKHIPQFGIVINQLIIKFSEFIEHDKSSVHKRQARLILKIVETMR